MSDKITEITLQSINVIAESEYNRGMRDIAQEIFNEVCRENSISNESVSYVKEDINELLKQKGIKEI